MNEKEVRDAIQDGIRVNFHIRVTAMQFARSWPTAQAIPSLDVVVAFCKENGFPSPPMIEYTYDSDPAESIAQASRYLSTYFAGVEAIWTLIHEGYFLPIAGLMDAAVTLKYDRSGHSGGWQFMPTRLQIPQEMTNAPSVLFADTQDVFLRPEELLVPLEAGSADPEVVEAISDALDCFRKELYRPSIVMLGKAAEGAWIELGMALAKTAGDTKSLKEFEEGRLRFRDCVKKAVNLYNRPEIEQIRNTIKVKPEQLAETADWTSIVRDARNAIHIGVKPQTPNSYEKVAVLLMSAVPHFTRLYRIKGAST